MMLAARSMAPGGPSFSRTWASSPRIAWRAFRGGQQPLGLARQAFRSEGVLNQFGNNLLAGEQVDHGEMAGARQAPDDPSRKGRDAINDDHRRIEQCGFDGGRAAGEDGHIGSGEQIVCGVLNNRYSVLKHAHVRLHLFPTQPGGCRDEELPGSCGIHDRNGFHQPRHVMSQFAWPATRKHGNDGTAKIEAMP